MKSKVKLGAKAETPYSNDARGQEWKGDGYWGLLWPRSERYQGRGNPNGRRLGKLKKEQEKTVLYRFEDYTS